jgi:hypothetical protein
MCAAYIIPAPRPIRHSLLLVAADWLRRNRHKHPLGLVESVGPIVRPLFMRDGSKALSKSILRAFEHATARHGERSKQKGQKREIVGSPLIGGNRDRVCAATYP